MKNIIDIDCRMNLVIEEQNGKLVVKDATILSDIGLETIIPGDFKCSEISTESKLNTFPVFPLSNGYFIIMVTIRFRMGKTTRLKLGAG